VAGCVEETIPAVSGHDVTTLVGYLFSVMLDKSGDPSAHVVRPGTANNVTTSARPRMFILAGWCPASIAGTRRRS
jgi:hypothetical protein